MTVHITGKAILNHVSIGCPQLASSHSQLCLCSCRDYGRSHVGHCPTLQAVTVPQAGKNVSVGDSCTVNAFKYTILPNPRFLQFSLRTFAIFCPFCSLLLSPPPPPKSLWFMTMLTCADACNWAGSDCGEWLLELMDWCWSASTDHSNSFTLTLRQSSCVCVCALSVKVLNTSQSSLRQGRCTSNGSLHFFTACD